MKERDWPGIWINVWVTFMIAWPLVLAAMILAKRHLGWLLWLGID